MMIPALGGLPTAMVERNSVVSSALYIYASRKAPSPWVGSQQISMVEPPNSLGTDMGDEVLVKVPLFVGMVTWVLPSLGLMCTVLPPPPKQNGHGQAPGV